MNKYQNKGVESTRSNKTNGTKYLNIFLIHLVLFMFTDFKSTFGLITERKMIDGRTTIIVEYSMKIIIPSEPLIEIGDRNTIRERRIIEENKNQ